VELGKDNAVRVAHAFGARCDKLGFQVVSEEKADHTRLVVSNGRVRAPVLVYHTGAVVVQGADTELRRAIEALKKQFNDDPTAFLGARLVVSSPASCRYDILDKSLRAQIRTALGDLTATALFTKEDQPPIDYRVRLKHNGTELTVTQFNNGTLLVQGKNDALLHDCCEAIERIARPTSQEVTARFISDNEDAKTALADMCTPQLVERAELAARTSADPAYSYVDSYDQQLLVASECLRLSGIPLPEYSAVVMPAAKGFEGFARKILTAIGLFAPNYFATKGATFRALYEVGCADRRAVCKREKYVDSMLKRFGVALEFNRHFMMHSDPSSVTKVPSIEDAVSRLSDIHKDMKEIFVYLRDTFGLT